MFLRRSGRFILTFLNLLCCSYSFATSINLDDHSICIEEGWRWKKDLTFTLGQYTYDLQDINHKLAKKEQILSEEINKGPNYALCEFTVLGEQNINENIALSKISISISADEENPIVFRSGELDKSGNDNWAQEFKWYFKNSAITEVIKNLSKFDTKTQLLDGQIQEYTKECIDSIEKWKMLLNNQFCSDQLYFTDIKNLLDKAEKELIQNQKSKVQEDENNIRYNNFKDLKKEFGLLKTSNEENKSEKLYDKNSFEIIRESVRSVLNEESIKSQIDCCEGFQAIKSELDNSMSISSSKSLKVSKEMQTLNQNYLHSEQAAFRYLRVNSKMISERISSLIEKLSLPTYEENFQSSTSTELLNIKAIILHLHSTRDICRRCSLIIKKEIESTNSFINYIKNQIKTVNQGIEPLFAVLCSSRKEMPDRYRRSIHGFDGNFHTSPTLESLDKEKWFVQSFLPFISSEHLLKIPL